MRGRSLVQIQTRPVLTQGLLNNSGESQSSRIRAISWWSCLSWRDFPKKKRLVVYEAVRKKKPPQVKKAVCRVLDHVDVYTRICTDSKSALHLSDSELDGRFG